MSLSSLSLAFRRDEKAAVAIMFGLTLVPLIGLMGAAVDYGRSSSARADLQTAADAVALVLAKEAVHMTPAQYQALAETTLRANWSPRHGEKLGALTVTREPKRFKVDISSKVDNMFVSILGQKTTAVAVQSATTWGVSKIEIALVLDNTGSMASRQKMRELKKALCGDADCSDPNPRSGFVRMMRDVAQEDGQIRIALVPFDIAVRMPLGYQQRVQAGTPILDSFGAPEPFGYCTHASGSDAALRVRDAGGGMIVRFAERDKDTVGNNRNHAGQNVGRGCGNQPGMQPVRLDTSNWQDWRGCVWDRDQSGNRDVQPLGVDPDRIETLYPAVTCRADSLARMLPLVDVRRSMGGLIEALADMQPSGNTNLTIGLTWGAGMLTPGAPLSAAAVATPEEPIQRFMILLTDGDNTENRRTGNSSDIDARARAACAAAKDTSRNPPLTIYAIRVIEGNRALLQDCASSANHYREVADAGQLTPVFEEIARQIGRIRIVD